MKRNEPTIVVKATQTVDGFEKVYKMLQQQVVLRGLSKSTSENYIRRVALSCLHFGRLPEDISEEEINEYLVALASNPQKPSRSTFEHAIYGLRYYFRQIGQNKRAILLPSLKEEIKLPVVLNRSELLELFKAPALLKHRILLSLIYSAGLRSQEAVNLKISDVDFERKTIHIRQSKYNKDRMIPLPEYMAKGLCKYFSIEHPYTWIFNGKGVGFHMKDYADQGKRKLTHLAGVEFLHRFSLHILPRRFVRIRYFGIVSSKIKKSFNPAQEKAVPVKEIPQVKESSQDRLKRLTQFDIYQCPYCKQGRMQIVESIPRIRSPGNVLYPVNDKRKSLESYN